MAAFICNVVNGEYYFYKSLNSKRELSCRKSLPDENVFCYLRIKKHSVFGLEVAEFNVLYCSSKRLNTYI